MILLLQLAGASLLALAALHAVLWRTLDWTGEATRMSPLNARVFFVHTFFVTLVLVGLGLLSLGRPDLLVTRSELARLLLAGIFVFWLARLVAQPFVFDHPMRTLAGWPGSALVRVGANVVWLGYVGIYGAALLAQCDAPRLPVAPIVGPLGVLRLGVASVWLLFGLIFKALDALPRHRAIVARVIGARWSGTVLWLVALAEITLGLWMASGFLLVPCMALQTAMIVAMNTLELRRARDLLVTPLGMVAANAVFLSVGWYVALGA